MARVKLLRQMDGREAGAETEYPDLDAQQLAKAGLVELLGDPAAEAAAAEAAAAEAAAAEAVSGQPKAAARRNSKKG